MIKKEYINPELEVIVINAPQLLAGSDLDNLDDPVTEPLAPELDLPGTGLPGSDLPGFGF